ncbi:MAG: hypothetical protein ACI9PY_002648 [Ascidiaceihabitans sp.]
MNTGQIISGTGHVVLIGWLLVGNVFRAEPLPIEATEVSVISGEVFAAMIAAQQSPQSATDVAQPVQPDVAPDPVEVPQPADTAVSQDAPDVAPTPTVDPTPEPPETTPPPETVVADTVPVLDQPSADVAVAVPEISDRPVPRPSVRVAPEPVVLPDPEAAPDPVQQDAVEQGETGETDQETQEATAPEETATEIVTEAEEPASAPETSVRPPARRPKPPVQQAETQPAPETPSTPTVSEPADTSDAINDALAAALAEPAETAAPSGPPLSAGEKDALRVAVSSCWNVGSLSSEALQTTVVVSVSMAQNGKPNSGSIRMIGSSGGSSSAANQAFEAARRAILRCAGAGYNLPSDKYGQWKDIEMTFNPERMRIK